MYDIIRDIVLAIFTIGGSVGVCVVFGWLAFDADTGRGIDRP